MNSPLPASTETKQKHNTLIVDKEGSVGSSLAEKFGNVTVTVFVSQKQPTSDSSIIHIPYTETIPAIPDGVYTYMVYVFHPHTKELLDPIMKKAAADNAHFIIAVSYEYEPLLSEYLLGKSFYGKIVVIGDIFGQGRGEIDEWLYHTKESKKILLKHMGLNSWYPVFFADVIQALFDITLSFPSEKREFLLTSHHPVTQLTIAHALQKIDPLLRIDFGENGKLAQVDLPKGSHLLHEHNMLEELTDYYQKLTIKKESQYPSFEFFAPSSKKNTEKKKNHFPFLFIIYTLVVFALMPMFLMILTGLIGKWLLFSGITDVEQNALQSGLQKIQAAESNIAFAQFAESLVERELSIAGQSYRLESIKQQLNLGYMITTTIGGGIEAAQKIQSVILGKSLKPQTDSEDGAYQLQSTLLSLQKIQADNLPQEYKDKLLLFKTYDPFIETLVSELPEFIGGNTDREYLVLFQNNTELRPGGGFIGSYGLLKLSHGKFKDFTIHDVYDADGQLKGHIEPPFAIRRYLPLVHLYLRDSNFDIDFSKNAQIAAQMLAAETGEKVDGVISTDLSLVKDIIAAVGNIYVPGYNQTVTADNFFLLTEEHAEKNSFAGSSQKKDFLSALFTSLQQKLTLVKGNTYVRLAQAALKSIEEKHLLLAFSDPSVQTALSANGFSSALLDTRGEDKAVVNDFFALNEANLGVDKVNYYIKRKIAQKVVIGDKGQVEETATVTLTNTSTGQWPGGDYKNYLRFILPRGVHLTSILINGKDQKIVSAVTDPKVYEAKNFIPPNGLEVEQTEESGKSIFGFLVMIPVKTTVEIAIAYTLPTTLDTTESVLAYSSLIFKQPGVDDVPFSLDVVYPTNYSLLKSSEEVKSSGNSFSLTKDIRKDASMTISLIKK